MDPRDPVETQDETGRNRRQFMRLTGAASVAAAVGLSGQATAMTEDGEFETDPYSLGVASGDPLPTAVVIWTRLAPDPMKADGAMPDEPVPVDWEVATDESMSDVVASGTATAEPAHAHTVHVDVRDLQPNTEYYYQFEAGGRPSPVGRTKTAPAPGSSVEEFNFAFASCQRWVDGYYTAYDHMADDDLDLIVHLGDYIYEYGIGANGGARDVSVPTQYREETTDLETYRLRYGLYKSDSDLQEAHASAPWLVTRDDHEVDNNWAGDVPQDPDKQSTEAFVERRAAAFKAYYEHMPFRMAQKPEQAHQKLYRNFTFGDLLEFNVLDTRLFRDDQACRDAFAIQNCQERFAEDRTILGDNQEEWLLSNLEQSEATWDVLANQLPFAKMDFKAGEEEGYRTEQWDGYVADQRTVKEAFENEAENPVVITGDFHTNWANEIVSAEDGSTPIGAEFVGTSITSSGDGAEFDGAGGDGPALGKHVVRENDNVLYNNDRRGYVRCTVTPDQWQTDFLVLDYVTDPGSPLRRDARFVVEAGSPGLERPPTTVAVDPVAVRYGSTETVTVDAQWLPNGVSGASLTLSIADPDVATIEDVTFPDDLGLVEKTISDDGSEATLRLVDVDDEFRSMVGAIDLTLAEVSVAATGSGTTSFDLSAQQFSDDDGNLVETRTYGGSVFVGPPPVTGNRPPTDPDGDGVYEDLNGNGRADFDDVVTLFENFDADAVADHAAAYDVNGNGVLEFDDVVALYQEIN